MDWTTFAEQPGWPQGHGHHRPADPSPVEPTEPRGGFTESPYGDFQDEGHPLAPVSAVRGS